VYRGRLYNLVIEILKNVTAEEFKKNILYVSTFLED